MSLLTIAELAQSQEKLFPYIQRAQQLKAIYLNYVETSVDDNFEYKVETFGSKGRGGGIHASEASGCWRQPVYSLMGVERKPTKNIDVNMLMRFDVGKALHAMLQAHWHRIAEKSGGLIEFEDEAPIKPHLQEISALWDLHSSCDGVVTLCDSQGNPELRVGLEFKTDSDGVYKDRKEPSESHREQTNFYMAALDLPLMLVVYYNKSNSSITDSNSPWLYQFDPKLWEKQEMKFAKFHHLASTGELPERTEGMNCGWCPFAWTCEPKTGGRRSYPKAQPVVVARGMKRK